MWLIKWRDRDVSSEKYISYGKYASKEVEGLRIDSITCFYSQINYRRDLSKVTFYFQR